MNTKYIQCTRCVMDITVPDIQFDTEGVCSQCKQALDWKTRLIPSNVNKEKKLSELINYIKQKRKRKKYDCIIGLSGGLDSSYALYKAKKNGLRILAVHVDAGWNSEIAVKNIENLVKGLNIDLYTVVIDWEEMKDLQNAFFKSGVTNCDTPQDHAYFSALMDVASKESINFVITGQNWNTESILPQSWEWDQMDPLQIKDIYSQFSKKKLKKYPIISLWNYFFYYKYVKRVKYLRILDFLDYDTQKATSELEQFGWRGYEAKHNESLFTKFYQEYFLYEKFGLDKRIAHLSSLIISNEITRDKALEVLKNKPYDEYKIKEFQNFILQKLDISNEEWELIMSSPKKSYKEYKNFTKIQTIVQKIYKILPYYSYIAPGYKKFMIK